MAYEIPTTKNLVNPVLLALHEIGKLAHNTEIYDTVVKQLDLEEVATLRRKNRGKDMLAYRLGWARTQLKAHGLITNPKPGYWELTPKGKRQRKIDPTIISQTVDTKQVAIRLPFDTFFALEEACKNMGISKSVLAKNAIEILLKKEGF